MIFSLCDILLRLTSLLPLSKVNVLCIYSHMSTCEMQSRFGLVFPWEVEWLAGLLQVKKDWRIYWFKKIIVFALIVVLRILNGRKFIQLSKTFFSLNEDSVSCFFFLSVKGLWDIFVIAYPNNIFLDVICRKYISFS